MASGIERAKGALTWFAERRWAWPAPALAALALGLLVSDSAWKVVMVTGRSGRASPSTPAHLIMVIAAFCTVTFWLLGLPMVRMMMMTSNKPGLRTSEADAGCAASLLSGMLLLALYGVTAMLWSKHVF